MKKPWYKSLTILSSLFGAVSLVLQQNGVLPDGTVDQVQTLGESVMGLVNAVNALLFAVGVRRAVG